MAILKSKKVYLIAGVLSLTPQVAFANAGVPMIFLVMPAFAIAIVPIVIIESVYLAKKLKISGRVAGKTATISNLVSTLVGIPLTWILLVVIQLLTGGDKAYGLISILDKILAVTWQAPWLIPYESDLHWMVPVAGLVLLVPFFFVSWWSEYLVSKKLLKETEAVTTNRAVRNANLITYGLLIIWPLVMLIT